MNSLTGMVVGNDTKGYVHVLVNRTGGCSGCSKGTGGCSGCMTSSKDISIVEDPIGAGPGDMVRVELNSSDVIKGAALLYLLPVISLMGGAFAGKSLGPLLHVSETIGMFGGCFLGLLLAVTIIKLVDGSHWARRKLNPRVTAILYPHATNS